MKKNKNVLAIQYALMFVEAHKKEFEKWIAEEYARKYISHLDKVYGVADDKEDNLLDI